MYALGGASKGLPLRLPGTALLVILTTGMAWSQDLSGVPHVMSTLDGAAEYRLGGAAVRAPLPAPLLLAPETSEPRLRLSVPRLIRQTSEKVQRTAFGGLRFYFGEAWNEGEDVFQLGTAITRGQTTAGVSVTYQDEGYDLTSSELYLDYALTERFSVGISGILNQDVTENETPVPQFGLNAELSTPNGTFVRGGIADTGSSEPIFGLAIGLRF